jgi:hypothetical protein
LFCDCFDKIRLLKAFLWFRFQSSAQQKYDSALSRAESTTNDASERARAAAHDAQAKLDSYKKSAESTIYGARDDAKAKTDAKAKEVEDAGRGWFGWGKGK